MGPTVYQRVAGYERAVLTQIREASMERETGFEPATPCLEGRNSTAELLPPEL